MRVTFQGQDIPVTVWSPDVGVIGDVLAYDTETTVELDPSVVPEYVIGSLYNGAQAFFLRRQDTHEFWAMHQHAKVYMHTASFDIAVTEAVSGFDFGPMIAAERIIDAAILYRLCVLAHTGQVPRKGYGLDAVSEKLLGVELAKDDEIRLGFGRFLHDGVVDYGMLPKASLQYAALDAVATFKVCDDLLDTSEQLCKLHGANNLLSHNVQLKGEVALRAVERFGLRVDMEMIDQLDQSLEEQRLAQLGVLHSYGYVPGRPGVKKVYNDIIRQAEQEMSVTIPKTPKTGDKKSGEQDLAPLAGHPFVDAYLGEKGLSKVRSTYVRHLRDSGGRIHPHYTAMVNTGRTSCSKPNIQNLPRQGGVRECIVPAPGHVLLTCDYAGLEHAVLAQVLYDRYGFSRMRELINQGVDLHRYTAAEILTKPAGEVTKEERQRAKAVGFGIPGGMSARTLVQYAADVYGVQLSPEEAESWRGHWLDLFPEVKPFLEDRSMLEKIVRGYDLSDFPSDGRTVSEEIAGMLLIRMAGGAKATRQGRPFTPREMDWAWSKIAASPWVPKCLENAVTKRRGSKDVQRGIVPLETIVLPSGRIRARCTYTQARNGFFQSEAADGAKLALYDLIRAEYRIVAFIHDEVLVELPEAEGYRPRAEAISQIMIDAMKKVCPDVTIRTEYAVTRRWRKDAVATYDEDGRLIPMEDAKKRIII